MPISTEQRERLEYVSTWYKYLVDDYTKFIEYLKTAPRPKDLPGSLEIVDQGIVVSGYGYTATARPRIVSNSSGSLAAELKFSVHISEDEELPVAKIYFTDERLKSSLNGAGCHICDAANHLVVRRIVEEVLTGLVESTLFKPE